MSGRSAEEVCRFVDSTIIEFAPNAPGESVSGMRLIEDLGYHSLAMLELAFAIEDELNIPPMSEEDAQQIRTADDVRDYVLRAVGDTTAAPQG